MSLAYPLIPGIWMWMSLGAIPLPGEADSGGPLQTHHQNLPFKKIYRCLKCTFKCEQPPLGATRADISLGCRESQSGTRTPPEVWFSQLGCHSCKHSISLQVNPSPLWSMRSFVQKHGLGATSHRWFEGSEIFPKGEKMGFASEWEICVPR